MYYQDHEQKIITQAISLLESRLQTCEIQFTHSGTVRRYLRLHLEGLEREIFFVMYLDNQHRLIAGETVFTGTLNSVNVYPREIVKQVLFYNAGAVIFAHNHPSGVAEPSQADRQVTDRLKQALSLIDVPVLDHMVIGHGQIVSFADQGLL
ncbi:RadC family protein [Serratia microhaemolytica]|uniref:RadC family protein n=1 Tax=Serratia microhaemolytica TaxID=2675110 RepID=UPI000FDE7641|nr:DNA repair protein RadC [Serratia microhaemolytica]